MQFTILLTLILFLISSCGTYKSNPNIVPVDSSPRGLIVKNQKGKIIGRTPFFARIDKGKEHEFYFETYAKFQTTAHIKSLHYKCQIDWAQSIIPDSIFSLLGPVGWIITASSLGADYYSGGLWKCEKPIYFSDINFESAKRPVRKILVLPAFVKSEGLSLRIRKHWYQKLFVIEGKNGKHRDKIIELLKSFEEMNFKGITHLNTANFKNINKKALSQLAHKNKATHALSFKIKRRAGELEVTPILHDLFRVRDVVNSYTKKFRIPLNESEKTSRLETLLGAINLLPNAFSISYALKPKIKINSNDFQKNENEELSTKNHPEALPRIFTLFGFENV
ncbi:MAG: hypothetical protein HOM21_07710, partial [Halobacteriovoraceae bacterium]|nr:hypothetical protein [Halobacteriovoraceae bacterium]